MTLTEEQATELRQSLLQKHDRQLEILAGWSAGVALMPDELMEFTGLTAGQVTHRLQQLGYNPYELAMGIHPNALKKWRADAEKRAKEARERAERLSLYNELLAAGIPPELASRAKELMG